MKAETEAAGMIQPLLDTLQYYLRPQFDYESMASRASAELGPSDAQTMSKHIQQTMVMPRLEAWRRRKRGPYRSRVARRPCRLNAR